ncbi:bacillithiol biosynthesis cysteine-adding enzyme BshC [Candidatus Kryptonium thompsonii]|uniref:Putative cysteine ligase BshC n=5 Tax=Candidatus Kryptonium thompsonii TaxID=1633631 RepID=A0A0P1MEH5_9BACT|nr:bacillithiol biosynthesis cysteine-adding enzyme BshC [Candidatus Kryptonium thompsoni]CUS76979.1 bacillithiol biosynthesis cysteine-adding enzyme BshC [Candidatus Kryptonium thompsoni]CUS81518.1 bacillithiol biosynthesis cysteine-adding enzyme BshC [Candidatus Kryptonium thompsoni]CUS87584.1 bacillithiol biosynthesis cysteine-adding enzyme BshC [Candidatus Kryptonium thompsoni]CUS89645.1 bacillithiol biosynthesis cysteine-adding enzyme BshC [Candidatus Kryptonium thompsoni]CUS92475.1 bacil
MQPVNFRYLFPNYGGLTLLFIDYIYNFKSVKEFYNHDFNDFDNLPSLIETVLKNYKNRGEVVQVLKRQNFSYGNHYASENLELLSRDNTLAVVTGQQVGFLSGPLYTIYKIITAIKLSHFLSEKFPDYNFVPVFYLESEDHDFFEANHAKIFNANNELIKVEFVPADGFKENYGPVGEIKFDDGIENVLQKLKDELQDSEFKEAVLSLVNSAYQKDISFVEAFARYVGELFKNFGLIFLNPNDANLKKLLTPVFEKEIDEHPKLSNRIIDVSAELEKRNYHAQAKPRAINLFLLYRGGRYPIEPADEEGMFRLKGVRFKFSKGELKHILETNPQALSPNVILRPICQDTLLPTISYIAGPSEIAYFAQLKPAYVYFGVPMPVIFPRISATLIEPKVRKVLEKYNINIHEIFSDFPSVAKKITAESLDVDIDGFFHTVRSRIESLLGEIKDFVSNIEPSLGGAVDNSSSKILYHINSIYEKTINMNQKRNEIVAKQIEKLKLNLLPEDELQERVLNITYFLNKYGPSLINRLFDDLEMFEFNHQILYL